MTAKLESEILNEIRSALARVDGVTVWRNSAGRLPDAKGRWIPYGLGKGSADVIGEVACLAHLYPHWPMLPAEPMQTQLMVVGRFFAIEVKRHGKKLRPDQELWATHVRRLGGFCGVATSAEDAVAAVERCRRGLSE